MIRKTRVSRRLRQQVAQRAGYCCGYCRTPERITGHRMTLDPIIPEAQGGQTVIENLWLACVACNEFKGVRWLWVQAGWWPPED